MTQLWDLKAIKPNNDILVAGETVPAIFWNAVKLRGPNVWMRQKQLGIWRSWTWDQTATAVREIAGGLMHLGFAFRIEVRRLSFELFGCQLDINRFDPITLDLRCVKRFTRIGCQIQAECAQVLLVTFGLVEAPLVGSFGFPDGRVIFKQGGIGLRGPRHVGKHGAYRRQDGRDDRQLASHSLRVALGGLVHLVFMRATNFKFF